MQGVTPKSGSAPVIAVGSGNLEHILIPKGAVHLGRKHLSSTVEQIGGSCINYFLRMVTAGFEAFPIPQIGNDKLGIQIQQRLIQLCREMELTENIIDFISSPAFLIPEVQTSHATIVVHDGMRTIFSQMQSGSDASRDHILQRFASLTTLKAKNASLVVGHVPLDQQPHREGFVTREILSMAPADWLVLMNPGSSQYQLGLNHWREELEEVDIIQLNLHEIKTFFGNSGLPTSLSQIIDHLVKASVTAIITLNKFGAIGIHHGSKCIVTADPLPIPNLTDPTGAGDAFAAGVVCSLNGKKKCSIDAFMKAIQTGRLWASYACTSLGASGNCPDTAQLSSFENAMEVEDGSVKIVDPSYDSEVFNTLDDLDKSSASLITKQETSQ